MKEKGPDVVPIFEEEQILDLVLEENGSQRPHEDHLHMYIWEAVVIAIEELATTEALSFLTASALALLLINATGCLTFFASTFAVDLRVIFKIAASL